MSSSLNKIQIIGNLGADPELRYTPEGKAVAKLRVATNRSWPDTSKPDGWAQESIWFQVDVWEQRGERIAEQARKGDQVYVEGRLKPIRLYQRKDGTMDASFEIAAFAVFKLGKKDNSDGDNQDIQFDERPAPRAEQPPMDIDDIPY